MRAAWVGHYAAGAGPSAPNVPGVDAAFWPSLVSHARALGADPRDWAAVLFSESSIRPDAQNPGGAVGINQFMPFHFGPGRTVLDQTPESYGALPASAQLEYVARFWGGMLRAHPEVARSARALYWLNYKPATYIADAPDDFVITPPPRGGEAAVLYEPDGSIQAKGLDRFLRARQAEEPARWANVLVAITAAEAGMPLPPSSAPRQESSGHGAALVALGIAGLGLYALSRPRARPAAAA
jgi:hypothetical protein